ncbi:hypothetical protein CHLNCDRAFT_143244 [Chlorella variabilis]|uniref:peptidylprolyl isomerase n=1 Tax=Chlorella variabilis TaxID=554065 RepID=E1Z9T4_CHLVA|nr:hypothetical protein CHLNCDRAFT_143244 [Chlorella variabilis]EFN57828.1 hypothetical protein CHLNCDRAFT_143244 [Chlorella variabilis]|eukprot:XP_005849930.1 hypothetical protein CHLNCDRAFT_143244 [Chlorella variabilis]
MHAQTVAARAVAPTSGLTPASRAAKPQQHTARRQPQAARRCVVAAAAAPAAPGVAVREEKLEGFATRLHVTAYKKVMEELRKGATLDGYRKGKAPDAALIAHVGGMARVANSALSELLEPAVAAAMAPYEGVAVPESERIEQGAEELEALFRRVGGVPGLALDSGFTFSVLFDAVPSLSWKTPYRELQVTVESAGDEASDAAEVERRLVSIRKGQAKLRVVADRGLQPGDLAIVDFSAARADTGEELVGATRQSMRLDTDDADETFLPGIVAIISGMKAGEEKEAPLTFPTDEAFQPAPLRGMEARVKVKMTELFTYELPEQLTDEWAGKVLEGADLAGLQQRLLEKVREEREAAQRERVADAFTSAVGKAVDCEVPESLLSELGSQQYSASLNRFLSEGQLTFETVKQLATPELAQQFVTSRREELLELQRSLLGFEDIAVQEGLKPSEAEIEAEFREAARQFSEYKQDFDAERLREQVFETVQANKVMDWLMANCTVKVLPPRKA